ncbi:5-methylcytosine-specific restriction endonuclease McrA [Oxalobacteraceae bacterium GrIS 2.11]
MIGKIRKKQLAAQPSVQQNEPAPVCPICGRAIPDAQKDAHHLIPKSKGGRATQYLHRICHRQIHALFNETELARTLNTAESLREHPDMQKFIGWVQYKPDSFYQRTSKSLRIK